MGRGMLVIRRDGRAFAMVAVHLVEQGRVGLMERCRVARGVFPCRGLGERRLHAAQDTREDGHPEGKRDGQGLLGGRWERAHRNHYMTLVKMRQM